VGSQVHVISAPLGKLLLGYLPFSLFAILFAIKLFYKKGQQEYKNFWVYLYIFSVSSLLMTQIPTSILGFSMQMIVGIQLPLILMTLEYLRQYVIPKWRTVILVTTFIITIIPGGVFYKDIINNIQNHHIPSYIPSDIYKGIVWLDKNASKQSQLLCLPYWSSYAGIFSGTRLYIGGDVLFTPDFDNRLAKINKVLNYPQNESLVKFLQEEKIDYVFYDKKLQSLDVHGHFAKILNIVVYENNDVKILSCEKLFKNINQ
jgi:hypothetical protein